MKKLPYGISNYDELIEGNYYYVDKTIYIEKLENLAEKRIMFLRPRKFGKTLFTSMLENYYDVNKKDKFEGLFKDTYIGKNPTQLKNSYYILRFNFAGITTKDEETTIEGFREKVIVSIQDFIDSYKIDFYINPKLSTEGLLNSLIVAFKNQKQNEKMYVIIDEYDHFANELLSFQTEEFKNVISKNGKVRKWYEILKEGTESVVDRIFITGVAPITLDSMTSGFNIISYLTRDPRFNEIAREMLKEGKVDKILNLLREYLENLSNRDYQNFSEKYIKLMFYCMARSTKKFIVKSELELGRRYCDILLLPKDKGYYSIMIEFKYLKKGSRRNIQKAQEEAEEQIIEYSNK